MNWRRPVSFHSGGYHLGRTMASLFGEDAVAPAVSAAAGPAAPVHDEPSSGPPLAVVEPSWLKVGSPTVDGLVAEPAKFSTLLDKREKSFGQSGSTSAVEVANQPAAVAAEQVYVPSPRPSSWNFLRHLDLISSAEAEPARSVHSLADGKRLVSPSPITVAPPIPLSDAGSSDPPEYAGGASAQENMSGGADYLTPEQIWALKSGYGILSPSEATHAQALLGPITPDSVTALDSMLGPSDPVVALQWGHSVLYRYANGSEELYSGGTAAWRNNNPGNFIPSAFSYAHGAIGVDGKFCCVPDLRKRKGGAGQLVGRPYLSESNA
ncbi:MAG: hypothetical protein WDN69_10065 [Aliidongia sp.]